MSTQQADMSCKLNGSARQLVHCVLACADAADAAAACALMQSGATGWEEECLSS